MTQRQRAFALLGSNNACKEKEPVLYHYQVLLLVD